MKKITQGQPASESNKTSKTELTNQTSPTNKEGSLVKKVFLISTTALVVIWILASFIIPRETWEELGGLYFGVIFLALYAPLLLVSLISGILLLVKLTGRLLARLGIGDKRSQKIITTRWVWVFLGVSLILGLWFSFIIVNRFKVSQPGSSRLVTPSPDATANLPRDEDLRGWKTYTDENYDYEIKYPDDWIIRAGVDLKSNPTIRLSPKTPVKQSNEERQLEVAIGGPFIYSESGEFCISTNCEEYGSFILNTARISRAGKRMRSVNSKGDLEYFSIQVPLGLQNKEEPYATGTYFTEEQEKLISKILSTIKFPKVLDVALSFIGSH